MLVVEEDLPPPCPHNIVLQPRENTNSKTRMTSVFFSIYILFNLFLKFEKKDLRGQSKA